MISIQMENGLNYLLDQKSKMQGNPFFSDIGNSHTNPEVEHRVKKGGDKFSENVHIIANEPSLALFRIQEHVKKSLPQLVEKKREIQDLQQEIKGASFDTEYAINATKSMEKSTVHFQNIQDLLKNTMFMKQQLQYDQTRRNQRTKNSMYRPLSMLSRTQTLDLQSGPSSISPSRSDFSSSVQLNRPGSAESSPRVGRVRSSSLSERRQ